MKDFLMEIEVARNLNLLHIMNIAAYSMGIPISLKEGNLNNDFNVDEDLKLSDSFDINNPLGRENYAMMDLLWENSSFGNVWSLTSRDHLTNVFIIEDNAGQKSCFKVMNDDIDAQKRIIVAKDTDVYSWFVLRNMIETYGGVLKIAGKTVLTVTQEDAIVEPVTKEYLQKINLAPLKHYDDNFTPEEEKNQIRVAAILMERNFSFVNRCLQLPKPTKEKVDFFEKSLPMLSIDRFKKIAELETLNNAVYQTTFAEVIQMYAGSEDENANKPSPKITREDERKLFRRVR